MEFAVLGPLRVRVRGEWIRLAGPKQRAILGVLLVNADRVVPFDRVLEEVWGDRPPKAGVRTLRYQVSKLRDSLVPDRMRGDSGGVVGTESGGYVLRVEEGDVDAHRFEQLSADGARALANGRYEAARSRLGEALGLWRGDALEDFRYETFAQGEIARLEETRLVCRENRVAADLELGRHRDVVAELRELTTQYPLREELWGQLMVALYRSGQQSEALRAYQTARRVLGEELGIGPNTGLQRLEEQILLHELPFEAPAAASPRRNSLPVRVDSLIGRSDDIRAVEKLMGRRRLVTLTGFGGVGKTSLALETARQVAAGYPEGVWLVELASVTDPSYVVGEVASTLGVREHPAIPLLEVMVDAVASKELLLVVDNCEHLAGEVGRVVEGLLEGCESLRVLATSREPLRIAGEQVWPVSPLNLPDQDAEPSLEMAWESDAVKLLAERAQQVHPSFELDEGNVSDVASLCRRLDGIPLALELAAARLRLLSPGEMLERIEDRFTLLTAQRSRPGRHRSLGAAIEWSYNLLVESDQVLLRRLGVFEGGFTLSAAEAVCSGDGIEPDMVLDGLGRLVDASLVTVTTGDPQRFGMLESVHEFAQEKLADSAEEHDVRVRHSDHLVALIPEEPKIDTTEFAEARDLVAGELDNFRSALAWAVNAGDGNRALDLAARIDLYGGQREHMLHWFPRVLEISKTSVSAERVRILVTLGNVLAYSSRRQEVLPILEELGSLTTRLGDDGWSAHASIAEAAYLDAESRPEEADQVMASHLDRLRRLEHPELSLLLRNLAWGSIVLGDYEQAEEMIDEQELIGQQLYQPLTQSFAMTHRGMLEHYRGDLHTAEQLLLKGLGGLHRINHHDALGNSLRELAQVSLEAGAFEQAAIRAGELIEVGHDTLVARDMAEGHVLLARAELGQRDIEAAADAGGEALQIALDADDTWALALLAATTGQIASTTGDPASPAILHAAAEALRAQIGFAHPKHRAQELEHEYLHLRETLGTDRFHNAWHQGAAADRTQLVDTIHRVLALRGT